MDSLDNFRERFEALEQQTEQLKHHTQALEAHTRTVERRLRRWRGIAGGLLVLGLFSLTLPSGKAQDRQDQEDQPGLAKRVAALEHKLAAVTFNSANNELTITKANLRIVNGLGTTDTTNGLGNLIVGYNEPPMIRPANRTGSHNLVVGNRNNFSSFGGLVGGQENEINGEFTSISGGSRNTANALFSSISGGGSNTTNSPAASISGGQSNEVSGQFASISGGLNNTASGNLSSISGGRDNTASGGISSVSGGDQNTASGNLSSVSGGFINTASGILSSVSGGSNRTAPATDNWAAGALLQPN